MPWSSSSATPPSATPNGASRRRFRSSPPPRKRAGEKPKPARPPRKKRGWPKSRPSATSSRPRRSVPPKRPRQRLPLLARRTPALQAARSDRLRQRRPHQRTASVSRHQAQLGQSAPPARQPSCPAGRQGDRRPSRSAAAAPTGPLSATETLRLRAARPEDEDEGRPVRRPGAGGVPARKPPVVRPQGRHQ